MWMLLEADKGSSLLLILFWIQVESSIMSRPLRIEYPGAWYHIMNRARQAERAFKNEEDYGRFVTVVREASDMWHLRVAAYCLMPNHYHLLVQTPEGNISRCMRHIDGLYTQRFNRTHGMDGSLFRGRYRSILVDADSYLLQLVRYIHRNPLRAGLADELEGYPWSSHRAYLSGAKRWGWISKDFVLSVLSPKRAERLNAYREFMSEQDNAELLRFYERKKMPSVLGAERFVSWVKYRFSIEKADDEVPQSRELTPDLDQLKVAVCNYYEATEQQLAHSRRGSSNEPRNVAIYLCRRLRGDTLRTIAQHFAMNKYSSVSSVIERMKAQISQNRKLKRRLEEIISLLQKSQEQT
jgi:putative transposase